MAKQCGSYIVKGTIDNVCFYEMNGKGYARISNPLSSKRVKTAPEFEGTRRHAALLQQASPLACTVYKTLPKEKRNITHRRKLTGTAIQMLKQGHTVAAIEAQLQADVLIMLAELLINEAPPDIRTVRQGKAGDAKQQEKGAVKIEKLYKANALKRKLLSGAKAVKDNSNLTLNNTNRSISNSNLTAYKPRRIKKVAKPRCGLRGTALYKYYVALGVSSFRLPQYPQLVFCRVHPPGKRSVSAANRHWPQMALHAGVIFNGV